ncbi:MAG TPA: GatB/YqeY domain-containing protein [Nitrospirae bacterium]|nr:glutamyl-tRNA(Gln) amidotransferase subunit E [bacterium BMS3Abin06]HDH12319.1 GatB/YqeY domain-containing protein [Nitrospirota bacterium]HDZ01718.1 GatB/YqeY domain-containing protein [Nitrospirota bacterium]
MSISGKIADDFKEALKTGKKSKLSVLRLIKSAMKNQEIEKRASLTDEDVYAILRSYVKRSRESIEQFSKAGRTELVEKEKEELSIVQGYLPEQLGENELRKIIKDLIEEAGASGPGDMGKVMKSVMAKVKGQADGRLVNAIVREMLEA